MPRSTIRLNALLLSLLLVGAFGRTLLAQTCAEPPENIIAWWPFDETSGTTAEDIEGNRDGVHVNEPTPADGEVDGALRFDGVNDYVGVTDSDLWAFGNSDFSIEFWANFDEAGGGSLSHPGDVFIANNEGPGDQNKWFFALGGGVLNFHINEPAEGIFLVRAPFSPNVGQWYHLAVTRSGSTYSIFVDGLLVGSQDDSRRIPNASAPLVIGQSGEVFGGFMNGRLDEVTIYNRALEEEDVQAIVEAAFAGKCKRLAIATSAVSSAKLGAFFSQHLQAVSGEPPYSWSIVEGELPAGMSLSSGGELSGMPSLLGSFPVTIRVTDNQGDTSARSFTIDVLLHDSPENLVIRKSGTVAVPGRDIDYFILLENAGSATVNDIDVFELLNPPGYFSLVSTDPASLYEDASIIHWRIPSIEPGGFDLFSYKVDLSPSVALGDNVPGQVCFHTGDPATSSACEIICSAASPGSSLYGACLRCIAEHLDEGCDTHNQNATGPLDPNEKHVLARRFIQPDQLLVYPVHFENIGEIEARDVFVTDELDSNLDIATLEILTPDGASFNSATRTVRWELFDRNLLPDETDNVMFAIKPLPGLPSGTEIRNDADIQFEVFDIFTTNEVVNIIDSTPPTCTVASLPSVMPTFEFPISWSGTDEVGEIESYSVFVSVDGGEFVPVLENTMETSTTFTGEDGRAYDFMCLADDTAGNIEVQALEAEAHTRIASDCPDVFRISDFDADQPGRPDVGEYVELTNAGDDAAHLTGCSLVFFDAVTEASYYAMDLHGSVGPGEAFVIGNAGVPAAALTFPNNTLQNGPDAITVLNLAAVDVPAGTPVADVSAPFPGAVIASVVYLNDDSIFGQYPQAAAKATRTSEATDLQSLLRAARTEAAELVPDDFVIEPNYPNPFNASTTIRFALPEAIHVRLVVYDALGREVRSLVNSRGSVGWHEAIWDGRDNSGAAVASGAYFYKMEAGDFGDVGHMLLLK